jgi:hypothetical protein
MEANRNAVGIDGTPRGNKSQNYTLFTNAMLRRLDSASLSVWKLLR